MRFFKATVVLFALYPAQAAMAVSLEEKLCIFNAGINAPKIPSLKIISSSVSAAKTDLALKSLLSGINSRHTILAIARRFFPLSYTEQQEVISDFDLGKFELGRSKVLEHAKKYTKRVIRVTFNARFADQSAEFAGYCFVTWNGVYQRKIFLVK